MHLSTAFIALSAVFGATSATLLQARQINFPACAAPCLSLGSGPCDANDTLCQCQNQQFVQQVATCLQGYCKGDDLNQALTAAEDTCEAVGVSSLSIPPTSSVTTDTDMGSTSSGSSLTTSSDTSLTTSTDSSLTTSTTTGLPTTTTTPIRTSTTGTSTTTTLPRTSTTSTSTGPASTPSSSTSSSSGNSGVSNSVNGFLFLNALGLIGYVLYN